jgi:hypothetical protein
MRPFGHLRCIPQPAYLRLGGGLSRTKTWWFSSSPCEFKGNPCFIIFPKNGNTKRDAETSQKSLQNLVVSSYWLVVALPLWKIWVRQLGWLFPIYGKFIQMFQTTNQHILSYINIT